MALLSDMLLCFLRYLRFILPVAGTLLLVHLFFPVPRELFRKMLHAAAFTSAPVIMHVANGFEHPCLISVLVLVSFGVGAWPLLAFAERFSWYSDLLVERKAHEIRRSLLKFFCGNAALIAVCWGLLDLPMVAATSILMWGFGDASAALVGKRWGKHPTGLPLADPKKTWEGSGAMWAVSTFVGTACLTAAGAHFGLALAQAALTGLVGAYVELITKGGDDTLTVPAANACILTVLSLLF